MPHPADKPHICECKETDEVDMTTTGSALNPDNLTLYGKRLSETFNVSRNRKIDFECQTLSLFDKTVHKLQYVIQFRSKIFIICCIPLFTIHIVISGGTNC